MGTLEIKDTGDVTSKQVISGCLLRPQIELVRDIATAAKTRNRYPEVGSQTLPSNLWDRQSVLSAMDLQDSHEPRISAKEMVGLGKKLE